MNEMYHGDNGIEGAWEERRGGRRGEIYEKKMERWSGGGRILHCMYRLTKIDDHEGGEEKKRVIFWGDVHNGVGKAFFIVFFFSSFSKAVLSLGASVLHVRHGHHYYYCYYYGIALDWLVSLYEHFMNVQI